MVAGLALLAASGCGRVRPQADYTKAGDLIRQRVPTTQVYSPSDEPSPLVDIADRLTLDQALQRAMLANRELQASFAEIGVARADLVQSQLLKNPTLSLVAMFPEGGGRSKIDLGIGQDIADLWQIPVRKRIAQAELDQAILRIVGQAVELASTVKQAYHRVQYGRESLAIAQANIEIAQRSEDAALARFRAGQVGKIDVDLARALALQARLATIDIERVVRVAQADLAVAMGLSHWPGAEVALEPLPGGMPPVVAMEAAVSAALTERTDLEAQQRMVRAARNQVRQEWRKVFPSVELGFQLERPEARAMPGRKVAYDTLLASVKNGKPTLPDIQRRSDRQRDKRQQIDVTMGPALTVPLPIFDQNRAQIAKAVIRYQQEMVRLEGLRQRIEKDVRVAASNYQAAVDTVQFYEQQLLPQLQSSLDTATASYRAGEGTILLVIEAQRALLASKSDVNKVQLGRLIAADELERSMGGPLVLERAQRVPATQPGEAGSMATTTRPGAED